MALFFSFPTGGRSKPQCLSWCNTDSILAVGTASNTVDFYLEEGDALPECTIKQVSRPVKLKWHPHKPVLAVGYSKGKILLWDHNSRTLGENRKQPHLQMHAAVTFIEWSPDGSRVITGDEAGNVCVWSYRGRGMTSLLAKYRSKGAIYHAVFCAPPTNLNDPTSATTTNASQSRVAASCPPFFFGGDSGEIFYADDMGNKATVQDMQSPIHAILYHHSQQRLVILTKKLMLAQLKVTPDGSVSPIMKVKLSMASEGGVNNACWAGDGLLATCAGEQNVRFWDLTHNSNYLLSLSQHNLGAASGTRKISKGDRIVTIDYNPRKRVLAAGTRDGNVVMWKNLAAAPAAAATEALAKKMGLQAKSASPSQKRKPTGTASSEFSNAFNVVSSSKGKSSRPPSTKEAWKTLPVVGMNGRIKSLAWGAGEQLLAAETAENVTILSETVLHRKMFGPVAAIQVSSDQISLQRTGSNNAEPIILRTGIRIKGMDLHGTSLIVWNGRKCEVYSVPKDGGGSEPVRQGSFPTKSKGKRMLCDGEVVAGGVEMQTKVWELMYFFLGVFSCSSCCPNTHLVAQTHILLPPKHTSCCPPNTHLVAQTPNSLRGAQRQYFLRGGQPSGSLQFSRNGQDSFVVHRSRRSTVAH
jgi:intraflagellar transport protein 140